MFGFLFKKLFHLFRHQIFPTTSFIEKLYLIDHVIESDVIRRKFKQKINVVIMVLVTLNVAVFVTSAFNNDETVKNWPAIVYHVGVTKTARKYTDMICALSFFLIVPTMYLYNFVDIDNKSLIFFRILKGQFSPKTWSLDASEFRHLVSKTRKFFNFLNLIIFESTLAFAFAAAVSLTALPHYDQSAIFRLGVFFFFMAPCYVACKIYYYPLGHIYATAISFSIRTRKIAMLATVAASMKNVSCHVIHHVLRKHDKVCQQIAVCAIFWKTYYFVVLICAIPANLFSLHCFFFGNVFWYQKVAYFGSFLSHGFYIFLVGTNLARVSYDVHSTRKAIYSMTRSHLCRMNTRLWLKAMACLERMASNRKIGFTCLTIFTVTYATFAKVCI